MLDFKEVHKVRKELLECHLKDDDGNRIERITIPKKRKQLKEKEKKSRH